MLVMERPPEVTIMGTTREPLAQIWAILVVKSILTMFRSMVRSIPYFYGPQNAADALWRSRQRQFPEFNAPCRN